MSRTGFAWLASVVIVALPSVSLGATRNVPADHPTIQACIDAAVSGEDECVVAPGTYHETINFLGKAITVRSSGGADVTTIDATGLNNHVVTCTSGEGADTVLRGFTFTGGRAYEGGGMYNVNSNPTVIDCIFFANVASAPNALGDGSGGGMYNLNSSPSVTNCVFRHNNSIGWGGGGGMANYSFSNPTVTYCTFSGNTAREDGGGMYNVLYNSAPTVTNCTFTGNTADGDGGGMYNFGNPTVTNTTFSGNTAAQFGGGMYNSGNPTVTNCTFSGNTARYDGGGMYNSSYNSAPTLTNCTFNGNTAAQFGGGMYNSYYSSPTVTNCAFSGNTGYHGGGMYSYYYSSPTVTNCTFSGNRANDLGGGIYNVSNSSPMAINCILWGDGANEIYNEDEASSPVVTYSNVMGGYLGIGNIDADPLFADPDGADGYLGTADDDFRLLPGSPCINTGDPDFGEGKDPLCPPDKVELCPPLLTDLDGHARVHCERVDMGAYEFGIGDFDCNQSVDLLDFAGWESCTTGPHGGPNDPGCEAFDTDFDADVDLLDLAGFQAVLSP